MRHAWAKSGINNMSSWQYVYIGFRFLRHSVSITVLRPVRCRVLCQYFLYKTRRPAYFNYNILTAWKCTHSWFCSVSKKTTCNDADSV